MKEIYTDLEKPLMDFNNPKPLMKDMFYYTPDLSDLRIGYECEANITVFKIKEAWQQCTLKGVGPEVIEYHQQGVYRTKYLTKQDIENEGWNYTGKSIDIWFNKKGHFDSISGQHRFTEYKLHYGLYDKCLYIEAFNGNQSEGILFEGKCLSINELRTIQKLIGIK